jgi:repressor LexA
VAPESLETELNYIYMGPRDRKILTQTQTDTLEALSRYISIHHQSPTLEELAQILKIKLPTAVDRIRGLIKKGYVVRSSRRWRNLIIAGARSAERMINVPLAFSVGADNMSVFAERDFGQYMQVQESLLDCHRNVFAVRVIGESMHDAGISDGSFVLAEDAQLSEVSNGQKVIAIIGDNIVLKRITKTSDAIILEPQNASGNYSPIVITEGRDDFRVIGRFIDVIPMKEPEEDIWFEAM